MEYVWGLQGVKWRGPQCACQCWRTAGIQAPAVLVLWMLCQLELCVLSAHGECAFTAFMALQAGLLEPGRVCKGASTAQ
jgi:hypothetical protein